MFWHLLKLGMQKKCPNCGNSHLFDGYLTVRSKCNTCGLDFEKIRSDDIPAYFTIAIVGHLLLPLIYWAEVSYHFSIWAHFAIWFPITIASTLALLPSIKGVAMGLVWYSKHPPQ